MKERKLNYAETVLKVLANGQYNVEDKEKLYLDVQKFCEDNYAIVPKFEFRKRCGVLTSTDVDIALRNLLDVKVILSEEQSGLIKIIR